MSPMPTTDRPKQPCPDGAPCTFGIRGQALAPAPTTFRFQARLSQAKLPVGDREVGRVVVRLKRGHEVLCMEEFGEVVVQASTLDLVIGHAMSCDLDRVLAENHELALQVCIGGTDNCLKPTVLGVTPYAIKASHTAQAQRASRADVAGQAHWAHRISADRDMLLHRRLGTGYFTAAAPGRADRLFEGGADGAGADDGFLLYEDGGFLQWTPLREANPTLHISARDPRGDTPVPLSRLVLVAERTKTTGALDVLRGGVHVRGASDVAGDLVVRGQLKVERPPDGGPQGARVTGPTELDGTLTVSQGLTVRSGGLQTVDDSDVTGDLQILGQLRVDPADLGADGEGWAAHVQGTGAVDGLLEIADALKVTGGGLLATGDTTVAGFVSVSETLSAQDVTVGGALLVLGDVIAPNLDVIAVLGPDGDADGDFIDNAGDNCEFTPNRDQSDIDEDDRGDLCDPDMDNDGSANADDCLPEDAGAVGPDGRPDTLCDAIDEDCDGQTDEEFVEADCDTGGIGRCSVGLLACVDLEAICIQQDEPADDDAACDGVDSDCDGEDDEDYVSAGCSTGRAGPCGPGDSECVDGAVQCNQRVQARAEICNNRVDDDCDGSVDEGCNNGFLFRQGSQVLQGRTIRCASVASDAQMTQCNDLTVNNLYLPNGIACGPLWSDLNSRFTDHAGLCDALTGNERFQVYYACDSSRARAVWGNGAWQANFNDNGYTRHLRCWR